jgi:hypothetical protein
MTNFLELLNASFVRKNFATNHDLLPNPLRFATHRLRTIALRESQKLGFYCNKVLKGTLRYKIHDVREAGGCYVIISFRVRTLQQIILRCQNREGRRVGETCSIREAISTAS